LHDSSSLILSGFINVQLDVQSNETLCTATRPEWNSNSSAPLKFKKKAPIENEKKTASIWNIAASDLNDDIELVDEHALLSKDKVKIQTNGNRNKQIFYHDFICIFFFNLFFIFLFVYFVCLFV
jgi:hypothetical protein